MSEVEAPARTWPGRHVVELDLRSLALFRMTFGLVLIFDSLSRWLDATAHYSDLGLLPRSILLQMGWNPYFLSVHMMSGQPGFIHFLFLVQVGAAVCLCLGNRTRVATFVSWLLLISVQNRNPWILNGGDVYARILLFWMLFLPWGQRWSVDAKAERSDHRWWMAPPTNDGKSVKSLACLAVLLQVSLLYWFAALPKAHPSWVADYSAINISLHHDVLITPFAIFFRETFSSSLPTLTWLVMEWEIWGPFLLWFPFDRGQVRSVALAVFAAMHIGFEMCFEIGVFPAYCTVVLIVLTPSWLWDRPLGRLSGSLDERLGKHRESHLRSRRQGAAEAIYLSLILYVCCWNFANEQFRPALFLPDSTDWLGYTLRLDQRWNMFSPSPPYQDGWWVVKGTRRSGKELNLLYPDQKISFEKPDNIARTYLTQRRRRWMMEMRSTDSPVLMASFCRYLCWKFNGSKRSLHEVKFVELHYVIEMTYTDGTEGEPQSYLLYEHNNFPPRPLSPSGVTLPKEKEE